MQQANQLQSERPAPIGLLTGVRFFLALYVITFHFFLPMFTGVLRPLLPFMCAGHSAVSMFFGLSGYVLAYNYFDGNKIELRPFWIARLGRIMPAFVVSEVICIAFLLFAFHRFPPLGGILRELGISMFFLEAWFRALSNYSALNSPAWTLSCEVFFYFIFPLVAVPISRLSKNALKLWCCMFVVMSFAGPVLYFVINPDHITMLAIANLNFSYPTNDLGVIASRVRLAGHIYGMMMFLPLFHLPVFLLGAGLGRYRRVFMSNAAARPASHRAYFAALTTALFATLFFSARIPNLLLNDTVIGVQFCICLLFAQSAPAVLVRFLQSRPLLLLGEASYATYILQLPFGLGWQTVMRHLPPHYSNAYLDAAELIVCLLAVSCLTFEYIERPARRYIRHFAYGAKPSRIRQAGQAT